MKKIDKIDGCHHCPLIGDYWYLGDHIYKCRHPATENMDVSDQIRQHIIHPDCKLPEDT